MLSQSAIAKAWGQSCFKGTKLTVTLFGGGKVTVRPVLGDAVLALDAVLRSWQYPAHPAETGGYNCRPKTGSTETSNHGRAIAIDIDWTTNPYGPHLKTDMPRGMVDAICAIRTNNGQQVWNWGGNWSGNKDAMHFEIVCKPSDLATGIRTVSVPTPFPDPIQAAPPITPLPKDDDVLRLITNPHARGEVWLTDGFKRRPMEDAEEVFGWQLLGALPPAGTPAYDASVKVFDRLQVQP